MVHAFEQVAKIKIPYQIVPRRPGDIAVSYADVTKADKELGWKTHLTIADACQDAWNWQKHNPFGYDTPKKQ
jgi:UDP-glucose 4-epimerase